MSETGPTGPAEAGRLYGVGGVDALAKIDGLTKAEAEAIVAALVKLSEPPKEPR